MRDMMAKLKRTVNEKKTRKCSLPEGTFTFLGFTFGQQVSWKTGRAYVAPAPAPKKVQAICDQISAATRCQTTYRTEREQVTTLNQILVGWATYFRLGYVTAAWQTVQQHACRRLRRWLRRQHKERTGRADRYSDLQLHEGWGLVHLLRSVRRLSLWAST
jgi:RNA-directed DNA polymerase